MENKYGTYPATFRDRTFLGDWLMSRQPRECIVGVANAAREGDEGAVIALQRIENGQGRVNADGSVMEVDCPCTDCGGCARLILENAGVEPLNCEELISRPEL